MTDKHDVPTFDPALPMERNDKMAELCREASVTIDGIVWLAGLGDMNTPDSGEEIVEDVVEECGESVANMTRRRVHPSIAALAQRLHEDAYASGEVEDFIEGVGLERVHGFLVRLKCPLPLSVTPHYKGDFATKIENATEDMVDRDDIAWSRSYAGVSRIEHVYVEDLNELAPIIVDFEHRVTRDGTISCIKEGKVR